MAAAQSLLEQAARVAAVYLWSVDSEGRRHYDDTVALLLGSPLPESVAEERFLDAVHPDDRAAEAAAFEASIQSPLDVSYWTFRLIGADGAVRFIHCSGRPLGGSGEELTRFVGVLSDVSEAYRLRLIAEDRAIFSEQMIAVVSHDMRNPLQAILMGATLLGQGDTLPPPKARVLQNVLSATLRTQRLISELLDFTSARVGKGIVVHRAPVDFHRLVSASIDELRLTFPGRVVRHESHGAAAAYADADRIQQALGNLIANAVAYGHPASPISVVSRVDRQRVCLAVNNEGAPIAPELLESMFEPMVRGEATSAVRSVGLGLFIVRAIAQAHGGDVSATSDTLTGTTFAIEFPTDAPLPTVIPTTQAASIA